MAEITIKTRVIKIAFCFLIILFTQLTFASDVQNQCLEPLQVIFVNGVFNSYKDADESKTELTRLIETIKLDEYGFKFSRNDSRVAHNQTNGLLDLFEAYLQKREELEFAFWKWLLNLDVAPKWFSAFYSNLVSKQSEMVEFGSLDIQQLINEAIIENGAKVLVVAHSQGNFFANRAISETRRSDLLHWEDDKQKARYVGVATPTLSMEDHSPYSTLTSDGIIQLIPTALTANVSNNVPRPGKFDHAFVKHYLNGDSSRSQIVAQITSELMKLKMVGKSNEQKICFSWFLNNRIELSNKNACDKSCAQFKVDLGTTICHRYCASLCQCVK